MKIHLVILKSKIKGMACEIQRTRTYMHRVARERYPRFYELKKHIGINCRMHSIAYGLIRGVPYSAIERKCREDNRPSPEVITKIIHETVGAWDARSWTLERVQKLLDRSDTSM